MPQVEGRPDFHYKPRAQCEPRLQQLQLKGNWPRRGEAGPDALKGMAEDPQLIFLSTFSDLEGTELMDLRHDVGRTPCWFPAQMLLLLFPLPRD